jgi:phosphoglycolate phosphatase
MTAEARRVDDDWAAIVYDLDGTLVDLAVDWDEVATAAVAAFAENGIDVDGGLWELLDRASRADIRGRIEEVICEHEREGARDSARLALADELADESRPVGVCSLNCEEACRIALERHELEPYVDAVVGRRSVDNYKPHPEPLLTTVERLGATPETTVFVGDTDRDAITAERAGTGFVYVRDLVN